MPQIGNRASRRATDRAERPSRYTVFLIDKGQVPQELVFAVLRSVFRLSEGQALYVLTTATQSGSGVVGAYTQEVAEMKAIQAIRLGRAHGFALAFAIQREE